MRVAHPDLIIARLAAAQYDRVARRQLLAAGVSAEAIRHRLAVQRLHEVDLGVYALSSSMPRGGAYMAAVLASGEGALLSYRSAGDWLGLRPSSSSRIDVTVPRRGRGRRRGHVVIHGTRSLHPDDTAIVDGIPTTSWPRTLVDLAAVLPARQLAQALERTMILRLFDLPKLEATLARANGRRGMGTLRRLLDEAVPEPPPTRLELERRFLLIIDTHNLPHPIVNGRVQGLEVDFHWPTERLIVETDGRETHDTSIAFERDHQRDLELELAGWHVLRITWRQLTRRPHDVAALIAAKLGRSRGDR